MLFAILFRIDILGTSRERHPPDVTLGPLWDVFRTWNKIENNAIKTHLYESYKIDVFGPQGRHPTDVFSERIEDVLRTFL